MQPPSGFTNTLPNELEGKPDKLHQHVLKCNNWQVSDKTSYLKGASEKAICVRKRAKYNQEIDTEEKDLEELLITFPKLETHALGIISKRAREFSDDIYFIALFLSSAYKNMAISRYMNKDHIIYGCIELARAWNFKKKNAILLRKELIGYNNNALFKSLLVNLQKSPRAFWSEFTGNSPLLRRFALKVLAIAPYGAACKQLFSFLDLTKAKSRNRLSPNTLFRLGHIKKSGLLEENISILFEDENEDSEGENEQEKIEGLDEINENIDLVDLEYEDTSAMRNSSFSIHLKETKRLFHLIIIIQRCKA
ncbi:hypothetical protein C2G38_2232651 [Gigaspora rosea]|uniref:HAT C-terminal dimerisation domain-containing protein n=1 Tax=Gigaspora rosea TaxID=44941 RepID=A0A397U1B8_9GLOM|nr:hypothetical protein C2G38_2232651 [Gigaspora rosea]